MAQVWSQVESAIEEISIAEVTYERTLKNEDTRTRIKWSVHHRSDFTTTRPVKLFSTLALLLVLQLSSTQVRSRLYCHQFSLLLINLLSVSSSASSAHPQWSTKCSFGAASVSSFHYLPSSLTVLAGIAVRIWQLGLEMRPFFGRSSLWAYPVFAGVGASFGYWMQGVERRQVAALTERKEALLEMRRRRAERAGKTTGTTEGEDASHAGLVVTS